MNTRLVAASLVVASAFLGLSRDADACSPPIPSLESTTPRNGDTYPANADVFFDASGASLDGLTVQVDGQPATLMPVVAAQAIPGKIRAAIQPRPNPGQTVVISGSLCADPGCAPSQVQFTAGPEDQEAPPATSLAQFDIYDYPDFKGFGGECTVDSDLTWYFHLTTPAPLPGESPRIFVLERATDASFNDATLVDSTFMVNAAQEITHPDMATILSGQDAPEAFCFRVRTSDAAGNVGPTSQAVCKPCNHRVEQGDPASADMPPTEPKWTSADLFPDGTCANAPSTPDAPSAEASCRYSAASHGSVSWSGSALAGILLALGAALRTASASKKRHR